MYKIEANKHQKTKIIKQLRSVLGDDFLYENGVKINGYWNLNRCKASASKFTTKEVWRTTCHGAYKAAYKNGWFDQCCAHMSTHRNNTKLTVNLDTGEIFDSQTKAAHQYGVSPTSIRVAMLYNRRSAGCRWAYFSQSETTK